MNFDRVADIYDETRGVPDWVVDRVAEQIEAASGADGATRFLEIGIGTGRIALPLIEKGYDYTGVDISQKMTARLRQKAGSRENLHLELADLTPLPFPDASFDVALSVHVLHLVPAWKEALTEVARVLKPGGFFMLGDDRTGPDPSFGRIRRQWRAMVKELGGEVRQRYGVWDDVISEMSERGWQPAIYRVARWTRAGTPRDYIEALSRRTFSDSWSVSDEVLAATHRRLLEWAKQEFGNIDEVMEDVSEFSLAVGRVGE